MPFAMSEYEKLGLFYLGRNYDLAGAKPTDEAFLYDSADLLTHAVCIGMTGSGKTGLCLDLIEEAAIDGVPVIAIDPKGDIANLLLTFPNLAADEFRPWVSEDDAKRAGVTPDQFAQSESKRWQDGLAAWGQDAQRVRRLKQSAEFVVYTPGSTAGRSVSIVGSLAAPSQSVRDDADSFKERINSTAGPLLAMLGVDTDPLKSREHILLAKILEQSWTEGKDLALSDLIQLIQKPSFNTIGALDLESFFPAKERFAFAMSINNMLAAPGFGSWLKGDPLSIDTFLYNSSGRPKISIFSIAHLSDSERMFFVTILLSQLVSWMRGQSGVTSLRAILYMDEIFGFFPPVANPPSKTPLLTLLKQARAFGLGIVLASQNPVDLDYKGLSNAGTWFIGRLQTERDKNRVLDGLEGAASEAGAKFDRGAMERTLASLGRRIFLVNNVHSDEQKIIESRWALSYLRGPLTKAQIKTLMSGTRPIERRRATEVEPVKSVGAVASAPPVVQGESAVKPALPPGVEEFFLAATKTGELIYKPMVVGVATVRFVDAKAKLDQTSEKVFLVDVMDAPVALNWSDAVEQRFSVNELSSSRPASAKYLPIAPAASKAQQYKTWSKDLADWLVSRQKFYLLTSPSSGVYSLANESERQFRIRLGELLSESRDKAVQELRARYATKISSMEMKVMKAQQKLDKEKQQSNQSNMEAAISIGATVLGAFTGRRSLGRGAATAAKGAARAVGQNQDIAIAEQTLAAYREQFDQLQTEFAEEMSKVRAQYEARTENFETVAFSPKKANVSVRMVALVWAPNLKADRALAPSW